MHYANTPMQYTAIFMAVKSKKFQIIINLEGHRA